MKFIIVLAATVGLGACHHNTSVGSASANNPGLQTAAPLYLVKYDASEFEPNWGFKLSNGANIEFSHLNLVNGQNVVTHNYAVTNQTVVAGGWVITGTGSNGSITALIKKKIGGCMHSATGDNHRDEVMVASDQIVYSGCGGPI